MKTIMWIIYPVFILAFIIARPAVAQDDKTSSKVYTSVDEMPEYPGGIDAFRAYMSNEIRYPEDAKKDGVQGKVFVSFTVDKNGKIKDAEITKGVHELLDKEALRVVGKMPAWTPGRQDGQAVAVKMTVPVQFALSSDK